jgi:hypothetical protein
MLKDTERPSWLSLPTIGRPVEQAQEDTDPCGVKCQTHTAITDQGTLVDSQVWILRLDHRPESNKKEGVVEASRDKV